MFFEELLVWLLACYGVTFFACSARITRAPRRWLCRVRFFDELLGCYFCTGFWVSLALAVWLVQEPLWSVLHGFAGATFCYVLDAAVRRLEGLETGFVHDVDQSATLD